MAGQIQQAQAPGQARAALSTVVERLSTATVEMSYLFPFTLFDGITSTTLKVPLPRNALVDALTVRVTAQRVDSTLLQQVAQVRAYSSSGGHELVVDFGTPRTVSSVDLPAADALVLQVHAWLGSQFSPSAAYSRSSTGSPAATADALFPELRTERLRVVISRALTAAELAAVRVRLPEPPSGLELRLDGGNPVWTHADPVQPRNDQAEPSTDAWDESSRRLVDLSAAFVAASGDPTAADDAVDRVLELKTAVPCRLSLELEGTPRWRRIRRVRFDGDATSTSVDFAGEGAATVPLALPAPPGGAPRRIDELRWIATARLPDWRVLPPLGPEPAPGNGADTPVLAELTVDTRRAVCVRLPGSSGLGTLTGLRLPLAAGADGAEARVVLWAAGDASTGGLPDEPLPQGSSDPLTLDAKAPEAWCTFTFSKPLPLEPAAMPWMALVLARGELTWSLAARPSGPADLLQAAVIRRGPPNGPWKALPAPFGDGGGLLDARARLRLVGLAPKDAPLDALLVGLSDPATTPLETSAKGMPGRLAPAGGRSAAALELHLVSRTAGSVQLSDIDVISDN